MIEYVLLCQRPPELLSTGLGVTKVFQELVVEKDPVILAVGTDLAILGLVSRGAAIEPPLPLLLGGIKTWIIASFHAILYRCTL